MITKKILKPGMLVEIGEGEDSTICIVALVETAGMSELNICWNDHSGSCLSLSYYNDDLCFLENREDAEKYRINKIYSVGSFYDPFSMEPSARELIWERDKRRFSSRESIMATTIKCLFSYLNQDEILILEHKEHFIEVKTDNGEVFLQFPGYLFPNLKIGESVLLDGIIDFKNE